ncbi:1528_t:CDS:2, partial [Funneliformis geosporum]
MNYIKNELSDVKNFTSKENNNLSLQKRQIFETFKEVEKYLMQYCKQKANDPEKHHQRNSGLIGCLWH